MLENTFSTDFFITLDVYKEVCKASHNRRLTAARFFRFSDDAFSS